MESGKWESGGDFFTISRRPNFLPAWRCLSTTRRLLLSPSVKPRRSRPVLRILIVVVLLAGLGLVSGRFFARSEEQPAEAEAAPATIDSLTRAVWQKGAPSLFRSDSLESFREKLLLPFAVQNGAEPRGARRRGAFLEVTFPRGRPLYSLAHDLELRAAGAGFAVVAGRETGTKADAAEYVLRDAAGRDYSLRLLIGQTEAQGFFRMAIVITDMGRAAVADRKAWIAFPYPVTLVFPDSVGAPDDGASSERRDVLVELPMEPAAYPVVKPGPRALFIHFSQGETERVLRDRLDLNSDAAGFATRLGDRAIEHPGLMANVMAFVAERGLIFLDLTGSPRSLTAQTALSAGASAFSAVPREPGDAAWLKEELDRRIPVAKRSGEGVWVLRHTDGLPATLAAVLRAVGSEGEAAPRWVTLRRLHVEEE
jgi:polysaccharide deacetylase 2 family uncharacterized protein YibQ